MQKCKTLHQLFKLEQKLTLQDNIKQLRLLVLTGPRPVVLCIVARVLVGSVLVTCRCLAVVRVLGPAGRWLGSGGETPKLVERQWRWKNITCGDLPLQKTTFCLATLQSRLLMHGSAVRGGLRLLIDTSRR